MHLAIQWTSRNRRARRHGHRSMIVAAVLTAWSATGAFAQAFVRVTDTDNPITKYFPTPSVSYPGCAWADIDGDMDLDLHVTPSFVFRNDGGGTFAQLTTAIGTNGPRQLGEGTSWADYDNDGDVDCLHVGNPTTLYRNDAGDFATITQWYVGAEQSNKGWAGAWGDFDADGFLDMVIASPGGFNGIDHGSRLFRNRGDGTFDALIDAGSYPFTATLAPYTVPRWADYDDDGDLDLFIASGPASGAVARDYLYRNLATETGSATFERIDDAPIGTDLVDGQCWNWQDWDNDGDLDAYLTNYSGTTNRAYRNDDGSYVSLAASPLAFAGLSLSNAWGDFDNDGDVDVIVTNDGGTNRYFRNDGGSSFVALSNAITVGTQPRSGVAIGDYDDDGDLDVFVASAAFTGKALYRNDTNGGHWLEIVATGDESNRSAIGLSVRAKATIGGATVWQRREVSAQNAFNSHASLRIHFGLGNAANVDTLVLEWPSGVIDTYADIAADQVLALIEGEGQDPTPVLLERFEAEIHGTAVALAWEAAVTGDVQGFRIERETFGLGLQVVLPVPLDPGVRSHTDASVAPGGDYVYRLFAVHGDGQVVALGERRILVTPTGDAAIGRPNPFRTKTLLRFTLDTASSVRLDVYGPAGRRVRVLGGELGAGPHVVEWDGRDDEGRLVAPGSYVYRLSRNGRVTTGKMVVVR